jgi:hypothetical protein
VGILSKYEIESSHLLVAPGGERVHAVLKCLLRVDGLTVAAYSAHLDHRNYGAYLPRGYSPVEWTKIEAPVTDPVAILAANRKSLRDETIRLFIADAKEEIARGRFVFIGGDFNEPSHLDWQADTKDIRDHGGAIVNWDVSLLLQEAGYRDAYRERFPDPVLHPGFTWPAGNTSVKLKSLYTAKDADERDRIDFVHYYPHPAVKLADIRIAGPVASVDHGQIALENTSGPLLIPKGVWPSDHKGHLATFRLMDVPDKIAVPKKLTFAFLTDVHLNRANDHRRLDGLEQALEDVKQTGAEFVFFGGDLTDNSGMGYEITRAQADSMIDVFKETVDASGIEYYPAIGNHDRYFDPAAGYVVGDELFKTYFEDSYYTFDRQGIHFFVLNSVVPGAKGDFVVDPEQLSWLRRELQHIPLAAPIVLITHVPVYSIYHAVVGEKFAITDVIGNHRELLDVFKDHQLKLVLQGHQHVYEDLFSQDVQYITGGAVCANWWKGPFHGTEEGFLLIEVDDANRFTWRYVDYGWEAAE